MRVGLMALDRLLRGELGAEGPCQENRSIALQSLMLGAIYGLCMGLFAIMNRGWEGVLQMLAAALKVPLLFLLTLLVAFPSLYVFSALLRSQLRARAILRIIMAAIAVNLATLASLGPIVAFFTLSTRSYPFMVLLNVLMFTIAGFIGLGFLLRTLRRTFAPQVNETSDGKTTAGIRSSWLFKIWLVIFAVVGAQMGWILRPFVGHPDMPFTIFRERWSNFFAAVISMLVDLLS